MRSDTAFFSAAVISRRFLCGLTSGWLSAEAAVALLGEERRDAERAAGAEAPRDDAPVVAGVTAALREQAAPSRKALPSSYSTVSSKVMPRGRVKGAVVVR